MKNPLLALLIVGCDAGTSMDPPAILDGSASRGPLTGVAHLDLGLYHSCARMTDGTARCWGRINEGTVIYLAHWQPRMVRDLTGALEFARGNPGAEHHCVLMPDATTHCWGKNSFGELGDDTKGGRGV